jgi:F-type H+-transporting ATPase subunit epsilon
MASHPETSTEPRRPSESGDRRLQCVVVTPEKTVLDETVDFVALPLFDGELGVLPGRSPLIGRLGFGELRLSEGDTVRRYFLDGGFAQVRDDVVTVLTNRAVPADQIDTNQAVEDLDQVKSQRARSESEYDEKAKNIARARARLRVGRRRARTV